MKTRSGTNRKKENSVTENVESEYVCSKCNVPVPNEMAMICDGFCQEGFHSNCVDIDNEMFVLINDNTDKIKWFCEECLKKLNMLFHKSPKIDESCDWPSIINIVLTELETQSKNNVALCERIDILSERYEKINWDLKEVKENNLMLNSLIKKSECLKKHNVTVTPALNVSQRSGVRPTDFISNGSSTGTIHSQRSQMETSGDSGRGLTSNNITYSRVVTNSSFVNKPEENKAHENGMSDDDGFVVYNSRRRRSVPKRSLNRNSSDSTPQDASVPRPIVGKKTGGDNRLRAATKRSWVFVSRLDTSVTKENLELYLKNSKVEDFVCLELETKYDTYKSFKIGVSDISFEKIMDPEFWDEGILVKEYVPLRKQHRSNFLVNHRG